MALFAQDTFDEAGAPALENHTAATCTGTHTSGLDWVEHGSYTGGSLVISPNGRVRPTVDSLTLYYADITPGAADQDVEIQSYYASNQGHAGAAGRIATGADTMYFAIMFNGGVELYKRVTGTNTFLGDYPSYAPTAGDQDWLKLEIRDATKRVYLNEGGGYSQVISSTDNAITATGVTGLRCNPSGTPSDSVGWHYAEFKATDTTSAAATRVPTMALLGAGP